MPCRYDGSGYGTDGDGRAVKALCRVMKSLKVKWPSVRAEILKRYSHVREVVREHEREDCARVARARQAIREKRMRKTALKKLTPAERRSLGILSE